MKKYDNIIFDVGDVLLEYRWKQMLMDCGLSEEEAIRVGHELFDDNDDLWHIFDLAIMSDEEILNAYCKKYPNDSEIITFFMHHGEFMHVARYDIWKEVHRLKTAGYHIYLLSNYPKSLFKKHTEYADFMNDIDGLMVSYMINITKPDKRIYQALCDKYSLDKSKCLFFDDRKENVLAARKFGMDSTLVTDRNFLLNELKNYKIKRHFPFGRCRRLSIKWLNRAEFLKFRKTIRKAGICSCRKYFNKLQFEKWLEHRVQAIFGIFVFCSGAVPSYSSRSQNTKFISLSTFSSV